LQECQSYALGRGVPFDLYTRYCYTPISMIISFKANLILEHTYQKSVYLSLTAKGLIAIAFAIAVMIALFGVIGGGPGR
jgi:hypothetical protein